MTRSSYRKKSKHITLPSALGVLLVLISFYTYHSTYCTKHFLPNMGINGINVDSLTVEKTNERLKKAYSDEKLIIKEDGKVWQEVLKPELGYKDGFTSELSPILNEQDEWTWGMTYVSAAERQKTDPISQDHQKLDTTVQTLTTRLIDLNKSRTPITNTTIEKSDDSLAIKPEVNGNITNINAAVKRVKSIANPGKDTIGLAEFKKEPGVISGGSSLKEQFKSMNTTARIKATYSINRETFQTPPGDIISWLTCDERVDLDTEQIRQYVTDSGTKYNTGTNDTKPESTKRGGVTVPVGIYSWMV